MSSKILVYSWTDKCKDLRCKGFKGSRVLDSFQKILEKGFEFSIASFGRFCYLDRQEYFMRRYKLVLCFIFSLVQILPAQDNLSPRHEEWLELVKPIITKIEREIFEQLSTNTDRDKFIQTFWRRHDTKPDTEANEFYEEYMERVRFADKYFGFETFGKGHESERGYFYLLLGPPLERHVYATQSELWPLELWFYKGDANLGLPPYFYLIFYQDKGIGEYRLYSPGLDGPDKLVVPSMAGRVLNRDSAHKMVKEISGELASASLSYIPGDADREISSFSSVNLISSIYSVAEKKISDSYVRDFVFYKDYVETDYSHNFVESNSTLKILKNADQFYVHWTLEPTQMNFAQDQDRYYASLRLIIIVEDLLGRRILEKEEEIPLSISPEDFLKYDKKLFAIQDLLPVLPGRFKLSFFLQNKTTKDFTSFQTDISVPTDSKDPQLGSLLVYLAREQLPEVQQNNMKAFTFNGLHYVINSQNHLLPNRGCGIYFQMYNFPDKKDMSLIVEFISMDTSSVAYSLIKTIDEVLTPDGMGIDIYPISLVSVKPDYYGLEVSFLDKNGEKVFSQRENIILLSQSAPVVPLVYAKLHEASPNVEFLFLLAFQYFLSQEYEKAQNYLEHILDIRDSVRPRLLLGQTFFARKKFADSIAVVLPVFQKTQDRKSGKLLAANYARLKNWASALVYLEKLLETATELSVLNLAAECYINLSQPEKALPLLQKSLDIDPNQIKIKELIEKIKRRILSLLRNI